MRCTGVSTSSGVSQTAGSSRSAATPVASVVSDLAMRSGLRVGHELQARLEALEHPATGFAGPIEGVPDGDDVAAGRKRRLARKPQHRRIGQVHGTRQDHRPTLSADVVDAAAAGSEIELADRGAHRLKASAAARLRRRARVSQAPSLGPCSAAADHLGKCLVDGRAERVGPAAAIGAPGRVAG